MEKIEKLPVVKSIQIAESHIETPSLAEITEKINEVIKHLPTNKIKTLEARREFDGIHQYEEVLPDKIAIIMKVNEVINYINKQK